MSFTAAKIIKNRGVRLKFSTNAPIYSVNLQITSPPRCHWSPEVP